MNEAEMVIPHLFRCPISLDLFTDPVTLSTGQTYDRSSIEKWLAAGNLTCPVTMQKLHDQSVVPNHNLRHLIDQWIQMNHQINPDYFKIIDTDHRSLAALKHILESHESTLEIKLQTLEKIQVLSEELPGKYSSLIQMGFFSLLLELIFMEDQNLNFIEQALVCAIKLLPFSEKGSLKMLQKQSKLAYFMHLFEYGNITIKKSLCHFVEVISSSTETNELCRILGRSQTLLQAILHLLRDDSDTSESAIKALSALSSFESNRENLIKEGAVHELITYILNAETSMAAPMAISTLELLLILESGKQALINNPNGVKALVKMVFRVSDHEGSESAVDSLMIICYDSLDAREEAICSGVLTQLLLLLQSQCSVRIKTKARMFLKLLRNMWSEDLKNV